MGGKVIKSKLAVGPMSSEIIEAVFRYSHYMRTELMLIASKNQIDYNGGYVNNWTTKDFVDYIQEMRRLYENSSVKICRDHCGPGFNGRFDLEDSYKTIQADIKHGFDLIHVDLCHLKADKETKLHETEKAIKYCLNLSPHILIEIGTDENTGANYSLPNISEIEEEINFFSRFCRPEFYVLQTGSLVKEINQVGKFNKDFISHVQKLFGERKIKLKEHNADYLSTEEIRMRNGIIDAMNIAPQLGAVQTKFVLHRCLIYGISFDDFIEEIYLGGKWKKWLLNNSAENKFLCAIIAGHYHFSSDAYKKIIEKLEKEENIKEGIINTITEVIEHYHENYK